jgi:hypothetical protein
VCSGVVHCRVPTSHLLLCCAVLCCAVLCCAVLCCAVLCCAVLCCAVLLCCTDPVNASLERLAARVRGSSVSAGAMQPCGADCLWTPCTCCNTRCLDTVVAALPLRSGIASHQPHSVRRPLHLRRVRLCCSGVAGGLRRVARRADGSVEHGHGARGRGRSARCSGVISRRGERDTDAVAAAASRVLAVTPPRSLLWLLLSLLLVSWLCAEHRAVRHHGVAMPAARACVSAARRCIWR